MHGYAVNGPGGGSGELAITWFDGMPESGSLRPNWPQDARLGCPRGHVLTDMNEPPQPRFRDFPGRGARHSLDVNPQPGGRAQRSTPGED